ncbi:replicative DNA helicase [Bacillus sp. EB106-08-02-XG196]|uniref:replicative DNA helicase n=1 Tax=Bacillus sp. EB106-08-02-XG196 TaxID=2737049 RepID=UPI0015C4A2E2|nr:replicative DNA helicase [Bacillus sp. EB106-08-02-XG196]NWQ41932.1 replicative DNA helicase [Bacillus sp. EB106-08-02-XG196]
MESYVVNSQAVEEAFVGSFFLDNQLAQECTVQPEQLSSPALRILYSVIQSLTKKGKPIDPVTVLEEIGVDRIGSVGGITYIIQLAAWVPSVAHFHAYEEAVKSHHKRRKALAYMEEFQMKARDGDIEQVVSEGIQQLMALEDNQTDGEDSGEISPCLIELYGEGESDLGDIPGCSSGFTKLDSLTGGFQESDLIIIGARPSVGKTAFALNLALHHAVQDVSVIFSLEMSKKQLLKRAVCISEEISSVKLRNPYRYFSEDDWSKYTNALRQIAGSQLHIFDKAGMNVNYIYSKVRRLRKKFGEQARLLVIIDYLQLIDGDIKHKGNRQAEISEISRFLKKLARELNVSVIALSQLSRGVEARQDKRPMLSDLRESGQIEQDADTIAFLYRDDYYSKDSKHPNKIEVILAKQRNGPIGTIELEFKREYGKFVD